MSRILIVEDEVANDAACFVNPYSVDSIRSGFVKVIEH